MGTILGNGKLLNQAGELIAAEYWWKTDGYRQWERRSSGTAMTGWTAREV